MKVHKLTGLIGVLSSIAGVHAMAQTNQPPPEAFLSTHKVPAFYARHVGPVSVLSVRPDVAMLTVDGINLAINYGEDGIIVVDSGAVGSTEKILEAIRQESAAHIRYVVNTSADKDRTGGNDGIANAGQAFTTGTLGNAAQVIAHKNALFQMLAEPGQSHTAAALPSEIFTRKYRNSYLNGQAIQVIYVPRAHTDGDVVVFMRGSDVVVTGAIYDPTRFPVIDLEHGGSIQGEIEALNEILNGMTVGATPLIEKPGETLIIPARGPLSNKDDLVTYRDMVTIVRDRVADGIKRKQTLQQIQAADPLQGFRARYAESPESARKFVGTVYQSLLKQQKTGEHR
jgi:glyoxylase-like metal-dependent hydrolase (beta-lactamase superfamily II)